MKTKKEKALDLILMGLAFKLVPLIIIGFLGNYFNGLSWIINLLILFWFLGSLLVGYRFFIQGCGLYIENKGYSSKWGFIGLLSFFSLPFFFLLPSKENAVLLQDSQNETLVNEPFEKINIPELFLLFFSTHMTIAIIGGILLFLGNVLNNLNFIEIVSNSDSLLMRLFRSFTTLLSWVCFLLILFKELQKSGLSLKSLIGYRDSVNWKLISLIAVLVFTFRQGIIPLLLYNLLFVYPGYVEGYMNAQSVTNIWQVITRGFSLMILIPLIEGFFLHGIILQKWVLKRGVKAGVLISSLLYSVILNPFDFVNLLLVLFLGILGSILYFRTRSLIAPILFRFFYNTLLLIFTFIDYFSKSTIERSAVISAEKYQASIEPLLGQHLLLVAISVPFLIYFVSKNFPRNDAIIPYYANEAQTPETT